MPNRIKIFAEGEHNTKSAKKSWNLDDLKAIVKNTQAANIEKIPFTTYHPDNDLPVLGYADPKTLRIEREASGRHVLTIEEGEFAENFKSLLKEIGLNKVSIRLTKDKVLKHIGLVDAPAVKDLGYAFEQSDADGDDYEFSITPQGEPKLKPTLSMTELEIQALKAEKEAAEKAVKDAQAKVQHLEAKVQHLEAEKAKAEEKAAEAAFSAELDKFIREDAKNRLTPKQQVLFKRVAANIRKVDGYEFAAEDGKTVKTTALDELKAFVKTMPELSKGEMATEDAAFAAEKSKKYERKKPPTTNRMMEILSGNGK